MKKKIEFQLNRRELSYTEGHQLLKGKNNKVGWQILEVFRVDKLSHASGFGYSVL